MDRTQGPAFAQPRAFMNPAAGDPLGGLLLPELDRSRGPNPARYHHYAPPPQTVNPALLLKASSPAQGAAGSGAAAAAADHARRPSPFRPAAAAAAEDDEEGGGGRRREIEFGSAPGGIEDAAAFAGYAEDVAAFARAVSPHLALYSPLGPPLMPAYEPGEYKTDEQVAAAAGLAEEPRESFRASPGSPARSIGSPGIPAPYGPDVMMMMMMGGSDGSDVPSARTPSPSHGEDAGLCWGSPTMTAFLHYQGSPISEANSSAVFFDLLNSPLGDAEMSDCFVSPGCEDVAGAAAADPNTTTDASSRSPSPQLSVSPHRFPPNPGASAVAAAAAAEGVAPAAQNVAGAPAKPAKKKEHPGPKALNADVTGKKSFACDVPGCQKGFNRAEHLKRHFHSIHLCERPFKCPIPTCGRNFSRSDNLRQHIRTHKSPDKAGDPAKKKAPAAGAAKPTKPGEKQAARAAAAAAAREQRENAQVPPAEQQQPAQQRSNQQQQQQQLRLPYHLAEEEAGQQFVHQADPAQGRTPPPPPQLGGNLASAADSALNYFAFPQFDYSAFHKDGIEQIYVDQC